MVHGTGSNPVLGATFNFNYTIMLHTYGQQTGRRAQTLAILADQKAKKQALKDQEYAQVIQETIALSYFVSSLDIHTN